MTMIIKNVCLLLEALSVVICLHHLYGEKFRLDIATVSFLAIDMIMMQAISYSGLPYMVSVLIYPIIAIYCGMKFGFKLKTIVINVLLCVIIIGGIQMIGMAGVYCLYKIQIFEDYRLLLTNGLMFGMVMVFLPFFKVNKLSKFLQDNERIIALAICVCLAWISFWIFSFKNLKSFKLWESIMLFVSIILVLMLAWQLGKYKIKAKEIETELKMHELYSESFQGLVDNIKLRQHEFDNHINAIYSQHFAYHTYEELVEAQKNYCKLITKENRFNKLLSRDNPVIRGFLYGRFIEIDAMGIEISYQVVIKEIDIGVPIYKLIEILGDLINNAVEALMSDENRKKMHVTVMEADKFYLEVRNESSYISYDMLGNFFNRGYSKKGENRGLGLYNVKRICEEYNLEVSPECKQIDGTYWLSFSVWKEN